MGEFRRIALACAYGALLIATAWLLHVFAQHEFTAHLRDQAARALVLAATGDTPYRWRFDNPDSVIAGRVFGTDNFRFDNAGLVVRSTGTPFEIGLPLPRSVDLSLFPQLQIAATTDASAALCIAAREALGKAEIATPEYTIEPRADVPTINLRAPDWTSAARAVATPRAVAMLRLRYALPAGATLHVHAATLARDANTPRIDLAQAPQIVDAGASGITGTPVYRLPLRTDLQKVDIAAIAQISTNPQPLILLPARGRIEQQIALRNAVFSALPGAILVPEAALDATFAQARDAFARGAPLAESNGSRWYLLAVYAIALLWSRVRPARAPRVRAGVEALLALAGPMWLIAGEQFDGRLDTLQMILVALSVAYAISLSSPRRWKWNGGQRAWLFALSIAALAILLGIVLHESGAPLRTIGTGHVTRYLAWAFAQQYLICAACTERWRIATGNSAVAAYLGALGFALLHTPNAALMLATFTGGLCWCALYLRERALLPLAVSHALSALALFALLPRDLLASAEVSARFFQ